MCEKSLAHQQWRCELSFAMNPDEVKRREYLGLAGLLVGLLNAVTGLIGLLFSIPVGLIVLSIGIAITAAGIFILTKIPDVVAPTEDLW